MSSSIPPVSIQHPPAVWVVQVCPSPAASGKNKTSFSATSRAALALPGCLVPSCPRSGPGIWLPNHLARQHSLPKERAHHIPPAFQVRPEMERYEWVFIKKPELAKAVPRSRQRSPSPSPASLLSSSPDSRSTSSNHLTVPTPQRKGRLSPFLAIRHFLLPSKTASMFMCGSREGIIIGNYGMVVTHRLLLGAERALLQIKICALSGGQDLLVYDINLKSRKTKSAASSSN